MKALIVSLVILGIGGVIVTYMIGYSVFEGTVTESPYETGLKWDETNRQKSKLGWTVEIETEKLIPGKRDVNFSLKDNNMKSLVPDSIDILLTRPTTSKLDRHYKPQEHENGSYRVKIDFPEFGYWDIVFTVRKGKQMVMLKESIYVNKKMETKP